MPSRSPNRARRLARSAHLAATSLLLCSCVAEPPPDAGAVVESCAAGETAEVAGLRPGDIVIEWRQGAAASAVESPFHLALVEQELAPHGAVELAVRRGRELLRVELPTGRWKLDASPALDPSVAARAGEAQTAEDRGDFAAAADLWSALAGDAASRDEVLDGAWFSIRQGVALARSGRPDACRSALDGAAADIADARILAAYWERAGDALQQGGQAAVAADAFRSGIGVLEAEGPQSPALAFTLLRLCQTNMRACDSEAVRALGIYREACGDVVETANALNLIGASCFYRSDLDAAADQYREALEIVRRVAPGRPLEGDLLGNLGLVALRRGDFGAAEDHFQGQMKIAEGFGPGTLTFPYAANYLGLLAKKMGRFDEARLYYDQALSAFRAVRPDGPEVAGALTNVANVRLLQGDFDGARRSHEEALALRRRIDPAGPDIAESLHNLGNVARIQGDLAAARRSLDEALALKETLDPGSAWSATTLFELGEVDRVEGQLDASERRHLQVLETRRRIAPRHPDVAASLIALGQIEHARRRSDTAEALWREAVGIFEDRRLGSRITEEERSVFKALFMPCYRELAGLLVEQDRADEAWDLLERARAGALRAVVARRDVAPGGIPPEQWFAKTRAETRVSRIESVLARLDPAVDGDEWARSRDQLNAAEQELEDVLGRIREASPQWAQAAAPAAVGSAAVSASLDPATVVLSYCVDEQGVTILGLGGDSSGDGGVRAHRVTIAERELARRVGVLNALILRGRTTSEIEPALAAQASRLFELLVGPELDAVAAADRVLIVPDGPLVDLPFGALLVPGDPPAFLGHTKALFFDPSASVFAELATQRRVRAGVAATVVAFGDPDYPARSSVVADRRLQPLPGSRREVEAIRRLFTTRSTVFVGPAATEENLRTSVAATGILHLAVHADVDDRFPMDSALYLSLPVAATDVRSDGVLSAWDIVDSLETEAGLVVLSACGTGRGRTVHGEGIIGLARAFQVAGAHTLVVSQWAVPDQSTADLMERFYAALGDGADTAEALRVAQRDSAEETPHPYHWAAFQVRGDWR